MKFTSTQSIGDIVSIMPKASEVYKKFNIDFCCRGQRPLSEAIKEQGLNESEILRELDKAYEDTKKLTDQVDFRNMSSSDMIDYIISKHHAYLRRSLPEISELATTILRVHGVNHNELFNVHKHFHTLKAELDQHMIKEEELLFPLIKEYEKSSSKDLLDKINKVIKETEEEHETAGGVLKELRKITNEYEIPDDVCGTFSRTYEMLQELESDLFQHIHLENNILFKRI